MTYFRQESDFRRAHGVVCGEDDADEPPSGMVTATGGQRGPAEDRAEGEYVGGREGRESGD